MKRQNPIEQRWALVTIFYYTFLKQKIVEKLSPSGLKAPFRC
jgi:hypothetical protein